MESKSMKVMSNTKTLPCQYAKVWNPIRTSRSKERRTCGNRPDQAFQPTMECKSMKAMCKIEMPPIQCAKA
jgi:hypothetical protein